MNCTDCGNDLYHPGKCITCIESESRIDFTDDIEARIKHAISEYKLIFYSYCKFIQAIGHNSPTNDTIVVYWKNSNKDKEATWMGFKMEHRTFCGEIQLC